MRDPLPDLAERLLRAGVSPLRVERYASELRDHLDDLTDELASRGLSPAEAHAAALVRLGDADTLALPMLVDRRFLSLAGRLPALAYLALPILALIGLVAVLASLLVFGGRSGIALADFGAAAALLLLLAPVAIGWSLAHAALRRRASLSWPLFGMLATLGLGAAIQLQVNAHAISIALSAPAIAQFALQALLTIAPFLALHRRLRTT